MIEACFSKYILSCDSKGQLARKGPQHSEVSAGQLLSSEDDVSILQFLRLPFFQAPMRANSGRL